MNDIGKILRHYNGAILAAIKGEAKHSGDDIERAILADIEQYYNNKFERALGPWQDEDDNMLPDGLAEDCRAEARTRWYAVAEMEEATKRLGL